MNELQRYGEDSTPDIAPELPLIEEIAAEEETVGPETPAPKPRKKKEKNREVDELLEVAPKKMNDAEKNIMLDYYRGELNKVLQQHDAMQRNAQSAYEQFKNADKAFNELQIESKARISHIEDVVRVAYHSILFAGGKKK